MRRQRRVKEVAERTRNIRGLELRVGCLGQRVGRLKREGSLVRVTCLADGSEGKQKNARSNEPSLPSGASLSHRRELELSSQEIMVCDAKC